MLRKIRLYGQLAKFIGQRVLEADVETAAEAVRFLVTNWPELERHMADQYYRVSVGKYDLAAEELHDPAGQQDIKIMPVVAGAGSVGRILLGVLLIGLAFIPGVGASLAAATYGSLTGVGTVLLGLGASLVLGGVAQLLSPVPQVNKTMGNDPDDPRRSFSFSGIQQTSRQGVPVPVVYGEMLVGSVVISAGIDTVQVAV
jgi:predicted phage tail protein